MLLWAGVGACTAAAAVSLAPARVRAALPFLLGAAALLFAASIAVRWQAVGHGPFLSLYEILLSNLFSLSLLYALAWWLHPPVRAGAPVAVGFVLLLGLWSLRVTPEETRLPASYDNAWLWVHVISGKLFLAGCLVAVGVAARRLLRPGDPALPADDLAEWRWLSAAFVCQTVMLVAGAAWARDAWGRFWAWDPLETWSFLTWLLLGAALHARLTWTLPARFHAAAVTAVFVLAVLTFLGVPFISESVHKGVL